MNGRHEQHVSEDNLKVKTLHLRSNTGLRALIPAPSRVSLHVDRR